MDELFAGLRALADSAFPKTCRNCGRVYRTADEFLEETQGLARGSGLKSGLTEEDQTVVMLFRNCSCGSTLMDQFENRRDDSPAGVHRRQAFGKILDLLRQRGLEASDARRELLKVVRGETSDLLTQLGVRFSRSG